jgi:hypothetical protein
MRVGPVPLCEEKKYATKKPEVRSRASGKGNETTRHPENLIFEYFLLPLHAFPWVQVVNSLLLVDTKFFRIVTLVASEKFF